MQNIASNPVSPQRLMQLAFGYAPTLLLEASVRLGLFDALASGPKTLEQVSRETRTSLRGLRAVMNALVGLELLAKESTDCYMLTPESATFLVSSKPTFYGGFFRHISSHHIPPWQQLSETLQSGKPARHFNLQEQGVEFFESFVEDLFPVSYAATQILGEALGLSQAKKPIQTLDLAAGSGVWGIGLAQNSPHVRVTAVDWAGVLPVTRRMASRFGLEDRFTYIAGDLLEAEFGSGYDIATLGHILHSMGAEDSRALLKKTAAALAPGGTIAISEWLVNEERTQPVGGLIFAVTMLLNSDQGDTYSFEEIRGWLEEAGFANARLLEIPGPSPLILAAKTGA